MSGERAAVEAVLAVAGEPAEVEDPEQLDLLGLPAPKTAEGRALVEARRAGRPKGARNRRTVAMVEFLLRRHADPRQVLLQIAEARVDELAAQLGCSAIEALQEKRLAAIAVLPYVAQRQPLAVDVTNRQVVYLTINDGQVEQADAADGVGLTARIVENVEFQEVSDDAAEQVGQVAVGQTEQGLDDAGE